MPLRTDDRGTSVYRLAGKPIRRPRQDAAGWAAYFRMVPDYTVAIEETFSDGPVVAMLGTARGPTPPMEQLKPENRWSTPTAFRAFIEDQKVAEWRVYCDNEPIRQRVAKSV